MLNSSLIEKFEVGYEDEMIGVYYDETEDGAINQCRNDMGTCQIRYGFKFTPDTPPKARINGLFARQVHY